MKQFSTIEKLDTGILYALELASSISVLLLAFGLIASMANVLTKGSILTSSPFMQQAFPYLDEQARQEYGTHEVALTIRAKAGLAVGGRRGIATLMQAYHEGTYTGRPLGGRREPGPGKRITGRPRKVR